MMESLTTEFQHTAAMAADIAQLWSQRQSGKITGVDGLRLYWCSFCQPDSKGEIILINGRIESSIKYQELIFDLYQQGFDVYSMDHRGQGMSDRLIGSSTIGHVLNFEDYVADVDTVMREILPAKTDKKRFVLAHSMGGAIAIRWLQTYQPQMDAIALSAPMLGIALPTGFARWVKPLCQFISHCSHLPHFAPGQFPYYEKPFATNRLTHSEIRYQWFLALHRQYPHLQVGGASHQWVWQAMQACEDIFSNAQIALPVLLLQGAKDQIVCNRAMFDWVHQRKQQRLNTQFEILANAKHELLFECDAIRAPAIQKVLDFFKPKFKGIVKDAFNT